MDKEYLVVPTTENTDNIKKLFNLNENSFNQYNSEFEIVSIKTIKESCKFLISLLDKDTSTYKKELKKIEHMESILINNIIEQKKEPKGLKDKKQNKSSKNKTKKKKSK